MGLELLLFGRIINIVAVPLGGIGQAYVLNQHALTRWEWAIASAVGWWLGMVPASWLLTTFAPNLSFWPYAIAFALIAGTVVGVTTLWVLRRTSLRIDWWWVPVSAVAGHDMVFLSKDQNLDAYIFGCPVYNEEARGKLEHMGMKVPEPCACEKKAECCPNAEMGRIYRVPREMLSQIEWDNPQFSYHFKLVYALRTKIERLIGRMKCRFKMRHLYKRGVANIRGHILKFMNLMHILASVTGTYGV